jgi:hypothetical protein
MYFVRELLLSDYHQNLLIFKIIAENGAFVPATAMVRHFVGTPQNSPFSREVWALITAYVRQTLRPLGGPGGERRWPKDYDAKLWHRLVPLSSLAQELHRKFAVEPPLAFDSQGTPLDEWQFCDQYELEQRQSSCMFPVPESELFKGKDKLEVLVDLANQRNLRRYSDLFKHRLNEENVDVILIELLKYRRQSFDDI